jgi:hypothetical protein
MIFNQFSFAQFPGLTPIIQWTGTPGEVTPPPTGTAVEDRVSIGTIWGALSPEPNVGGLF